MYLKFEQKHGILSSSSPPHPSLFPHLPSTSLPLPLLLPFLSFSLSPLPFLLFPSPEVLQWNTEDVCQWFEELGLEEYHESIHTHEITGKELLDLHRSDLMVSECQSLVLFLSLASFPLPVLITYSMQIQRG